MGASFTPKEAKYFDDKFDDGIPSLGQVISIEGVGHTLGVDCVDADWTTCANQNVSYRLNVTNKTCRVGYTAFSIN